MADAAASLPVLGRRELRLLSLQRRKAVRRGRERTRNVVLVLAGVAGAALLLGLGVNAGWVPTGMRAPAKTLDERTREFAATRVGRILVPTGENDMCRELEFSNDTGKFRRSRMLRCQDTVPGVIDPLRQVNGRGASIRAFFAKP